MIALRYFSANPLRPSHHKAGEEQTEVSISRTSSWPLFTRLVSCVGPAVVPASPLSCGLLFAAEHEASRNAGSPPRLAAPRSVGYRLSTLEWDSTLESA